LRLANYLLLDVGKTQRRKDLIQQGYYKTQENQRFSASTTKYNIVALDQQHSILSQIKSLRPKAVFFIIICVLAINQLFTIRCWKNAKTQRSNTTRIL